MIDQEAARTAKVAAWVNCTIASGVLAMIGWAYVEKKTYAIPPTQEPDKKAPKAPDDPWCGYYECTGKEEGGGQYDGIVTIRKVRQVYTCQWAIGSTTFIGVGQAVGDKLVIGWAQQREDKVIRGCTVYERAPGGQLRGSWCSMPGDGSKHREDLKLLKPIPPGE